MRQQLKLAALAALAAGLAAGSANAAVFTWTFRGVVASGYDTTGVWGAATDDLSGLRWTAVVRTDTGAPGAELSDGGVYTLIQGFGQQTPVKVSFTLKGVTRALGVPPAPADDGGNADGAQFQLDGPFPGFPYDEAFDITADNTRDIAQGGDSDVLTERIELLGVGLGLNFLPGPDFTSLPSLTPPPGAIFAGDVRFFHDSFEAASGVETRSEDADAVLRIDSIVAGAVPEPPGWLVLLTGFAFVGGAARAMVSARKTPPLDRIRSAAG